MMKKGKRSAGFTLVEIIVVLVILAILAAILIPSMVGWIKKTREKSAIAEARQCLLAIQAIAVERYAAGGKYMFPPDKNETLALAEAPNGADILGATVDGRAMVTWMQYLTGDGIGVTYYRGAFMTSFSGLLPFGTSENMTAVMDGLSASGFQLDSGAAVNSESHVANAIQKLREDSGIDLQEMGATTWAYRKATSNGGPFLYWTTQDISGLSAGDTVPAMRYNVNSGNYTVWNMKIESKTSGSVPYNAMNDTNNSVWTNNGVDETYENAYAAYLEALNENP